jgi:hypothetical protein
MKKHTSQKLRNHTAFYRREIIVSPFIHAHFADFTPTSKTTLYTPFKGVCVCVLTEKGAVV